MQRLRLALNDRGAFATLATRAMRCSIAANFLEPRLAARFDRLCASCEPTGRNTPKLKDVCLSDSREQFVCHFSVLKIFKRLCRTLWHDDSASSDNFVVLRTKMSDPLDDHRSVRFGSRMVASLTSVRTSRIS
ncbi:MAG: hypothetical protein D6690_04675 [Nitrospirae bacterium]|nr:MAG: hypothetical protein D6690_04675 [Nitrospirota bacterium]